MTTTTTAWSHLPNAALIDRVLADAAQRPKVWAAALDAAMDAVRSAARAAALDAALDAARDAALDAARDAALDATRDVAWGAVRDAAFALIAWDDAALLLIVPVPTLRLLSDCGSHSATLMLPAAIAFGDNS
jgi:hypothetical protein